ncbi:CCAAT/enhancer-binding protein gamma [Drosophila innubila]|uniref:CCAAT/enhancer-binding protein gamma n=1 Tax=Drosophila innubila TaxID=198719 RepID=UPI00148DDBEE|nr:CCAAT/enhancer-binding protein gamma [Drosophila innubila]
MPARRSTAGTSRNSGNETSPQSEDPAYKLKRKKNNEAVQRTREKTRQTAVERKERIEKLKIENIMLTQQIKSEKGHISTLRKLIIKGRTNEDQDRLIDEILNNTDYGNQKDDGDDNEDNDDK